MESMHIIQNKSRQLFSRGQTILQGQGVGNTSQRRASLNIQKQNTGPGTEAGLNSSDQVKGSNIKYFSSGPFVIKRDFNNSSVLKDYNTKDNLSMSLQTTNTQEMKHKVQRFKAENNQLE